MCFLFAWRDLLVLLIHLQRKRNEGKEREKKRKENNRKERKAFNYSKV